MLRAFLSGLSGWLYPALLSVQAAFNLAFPPSRRSKNRPRAHAFSGVRAAQHGRSMEEEARRILSDACAPVEAPRSLGELALELFGPEGGVELDIPTRQPLREPPDFSEH